MPRSTLRISIWNFSVVLEPHVHTNGKGVFFLCVFHESYTIHIIIFRILYGSYSIFRTKTKAKREGFPFVGWGMINIVSKHHVKIRTWWCWAGHSQSTALVRSVLAGPARMHFSFRVGGCPLAHRIWIKFCFWEYVNSVSRFLWVVGGKAGDRR